MEDVGLHAEVQATLPTGSSAGADDVPFSHANVVDDLPHSHGEEHVPGTSGSGKGKVKEADETILVSALEALANVLEQHQQEGREFMITTEMYQEAIQQAKATHGEGYLCESNLESFIHTLEQRISSYHPSHYTNAKSGLREKKLHAHERIECFRERVAMPDGGVKSKAPIERPRARSGLSGLFHKRMEVNGGQGWSSFLRLLAEGESKAEPTCAHRMCVTQTAGKANGPVPQALQATAKVAYEDELARRGRHRGGVRRAKNRHSPNGERSERTERAQQLLRTEQEAVTGGMWEQVYRIGMNARRERACIQELEQLESMSQCLRQAILIAFASLHFRSNGSERLTHHPSRALREMAAGFAHVTEHLVRSLASEVGSAWPIKSEAPKGVGGEARRRAIALKEGKLELAPLEVTLPLARFFFRFASALAEIQERLPEVHASLRNALDQAPG